MAGVGDNDSACESETLPSDTEEARVDDPRLVHRVDLTIGDLLSEEKSSCDRYCFLMWTHMSAA